jgi:hypothetical protein
VPATAGKDGAKDETAKPRIFVAVAKGPASWNWGYLSDCIVYELNARGNVVGMACVPRMINGSQFSITPSGVLWGCQRGAMIKLVVAPEEEAGFGMGPGGPDLVCDVRWYRQFNAPVPEAWFTAGKAADAMAAGPTIVFRTLAGGYIADKTRGVYRFPIAVIDSATGADRTAVLAVPFDGELPPPKSNFTGAGDRISSHGPYLLGITRLRLVDDVLDVTPGTEDAAVGMRFDVGFAIGGR